MMDAEDYGLTSQLPRNAEWMSAAEAADYLGLSRTRVRFLIRDNRFKSACVIGSQIVISKKEVEEFKRLRRPPGRRPVGDTQKCA
jgi:excisionase family DNA binding protein